jgi:Zn-dependent peptidase ImmA (M78 family)
MKVFHSYGSKERLFEMMKRVNNLNEEILPEEERKKIVSDFISFLNEKLDLNGDFPSVELSYDENKAQEDKSFGVYKNESNEIEVVATNRNLADILRTIAHEFVHYKQGKEGKLNPNSGETGSNEENEANALAGVLMREFGRNNPIIFE